MVELNWKVEPRGETAVLVVGGLWAIKLRVDTSRWSVDCGDGRRREGPAPSLEDGKRLCLRAVATALTAATMEISRLQLQLDGQ